MTTSPAHTTRLGGTRGADGEHQLAVYLAAIAKAASKLVESETDYTFNRRVFQLVLIRSALNKGATLKTVATSWHLGYTQASKIVNRKLWKTENAAADAIIQQVSARLAGEEPSNRGSTEGGSQ